MSRLNLAKNMNELRIHLSQTAPGSQGARDFVMNSYQELKRANPTFPILVREAESVKARLIARFDLGVEKSVTVDGMDAAAVGKELAKLVASKPAS